MRRNVAGCLLLVAVTLSLATGCSSNQPPATSNSDIRTEIQARYNELAAAFEREDEAAVLAFRTDDFYTIGPDGRRLDKAQMAEYTRNWFRINHPPIDVNMTVQDIEMKDGEALVTVFQEGSRQQELAGKMRHVRHSVTQRETWVRTPEGWKIRTVDNVRDQKRWVDGKRVDPTKPYDPDAPPYEPTPQS